MVSRRIDNRYTSECECCFRSCAVVCRVKFLGAEDERFRNFNRQDNDFMKGNSNFWCSIVLILTVGTVLLNFFCGKLLGCVMVTVKRKCGILQSLLVCNGFQLKDVNSI